MLGTADLHGDLTGLSRLAPVLRRHPDAIRVDAGDLIQGGYAAAILRGQPLFAALNALKYDVFVPGNHDFEFTPADFQAWRRQFRGRILGAQWRYGDFIPESCAVVERSGCRIGIIGLSESGMAQKTAVCPGLRWRTEREAVRDALAELRKHSCDAVILVAHLAVKGDYGPLYRLMREFPELDAAVAAHSHRECPGTLVAGRLAVQPGPRGASAAWLKLHFGADRKLRRVTSGLLRPEAVPDPELARLRARSEHLARARTPRWRHDFPDFPAFGRAAARILRRRCAADAAIFCADGRYFVSRMDERRLFRLLPFGNRLGAVELDAEELPMIVKELDVPPRRVFCDIAPNRRGRVTVAVSDFLWFRSPTLRRLPIRMSGRFERETLSEHLEKSASGTIL